MLQPLTPCSPLAYMKRYPLMIEIRYSAGWVGLGTEHEGHAQDLEVRKRTPCLFVAHEEYAGPRWHQ